MIVVRHFSLVDSIYFKYLISFLLAGFSFFNTEELSKTFDEFYRRERENYNQNRQRVVAGPSRITVAKVSRKTPKHLEVKV